MALISFLLKAFIISFSGAMQPGPVSATAITSGTRNRYAGTLMAIGHAMLEFPVMILVLLGIGAFFRSPKAQIIVGLAGGLILLFMAVQMFRTARRYQQVKAQPRSEAPILAGIILSAGNPYFLIWWTTIGLKLATEAKSFGVWAFVLFALVHWLCDGGWLQALSWTSFKGATLLSGRNMRTILAGCSAAMLLFGLKFAFDALCSLYELLYLR